MSLFAATGEHAGSVLVRVGRALMGLPQPRRLRLDLKSTPDGILVIPHRSEPVPQALSADSAPVLALPPPVRVPTPAPMQLPLFADVSAAQRAAIDDRTAVMRAEEPTRLEPRPAADHAMALLHRLQSDPATVGRVDLDVVDGVYRDMLIDLQWAERPWNSVSCELSKLIGATRKTYRNGRAGEADKVRVFCIPDPAEVELAETWGGASMKEAA